MHLPSYVCRGGFGLAFILSVWGCAKATDGDVSDLVPVDETAADDAGATTSKPTTHPTAADASIPSTTPDAGTMPVDDASTDTPDASTDDAGDDAGDPNQTPDTGTVDPVGGGDCPSGDSSYAAKALLEIAIDPNYTPCAPGGTTCPSSQCCATIVCVDL